MVFSRKTNRVSLVFLCVITPLLGNGAFAQFESADSNITSNQDIYAGGFTWDSPFGTPAGTTPSSTDAVVLGNQLNDGAGGGHGSQNYRVDATGAPHTVASLQLGSINSDDDEFVQSVNFQIRDNGDFTVTGVTTLGVADRNTTDAGGNPITLVGGSHDIVLNDNENAGTGPFATMTLGGDVEVQGSNTTHIIQLAGNGDTLVIGGDIAANAGAPGQNNGAGTTGAWSESVDLVFARSGNLVINGTNQVFNLDELRVGNVNNNNPTPIDITFDNNVTINADDIFVGRNTDATNNDESIVASATFDSATVVVDDDMVVGGFTSNSGTAVNRTGEGTANFGDASNPGNGSTVFIGDNLLVGQGTGTPNSTSHTATGTININDGYEVTVFDQLIVGATATGTGTVNVNNGTLFTGEEIFLGGNASNAAMGEDDGSRGTLNVGPDGVVHVNDPGQLGASTSNQNVEIGRDGDGFLNVDGGNFTIHRGNLVLGQNNPNAGVADNSRGTVTFTNGADVVIGTQGGNNALNINSGGGDIVQSGSSAADRTTVTIEDDLNMANSGADTPAANMNSSYTISGFSDLEVGVDFNARGNSSGGTNTFTIVGANTDVDVLRNFNGNQGSFVMEFDFNNTNDLIYDFDLDVAGNTNVGGATINFLNDGDLNSFTGDILLFDTAGSQNGQFANAPQGTIFGAYQLVYDYAPSTGMGTIGDVGGGTNIALIQAVAVPEPSSLAFVGFFVIGCLAKRRRRQRV